MWAQTVFKSQPNQYKELEFSFHLQRCHFILYSNWECSEDIGLYFSVELDNDDENLIEPQIPETKSVIIFSCFFHSTALKLQKKS